MQDLGLAVEHMFDLREPGLGQRADLGIVAQDALHDARLFTALLGQQFLFLGFEAQLLDQYRTGTFVACNAFPVFPPCGLKHLEAAVFYGLVVIDQAMLHFSLQR
ncbi:hypothetical protein D3C71_2002470 [compost metagenome]